MATITVTNRQDNLYFNGKLPTVNWGYCEIDRKVYNIEVDDDDVYTGEIRTPAGRVNVESLDAGDSWEIID